MEPTSTRLNCQISPDVNERLRLYAATQSPPSVAVTVNRLLDEHLPSLAELAERISKGAQQK